MVYTPSFYPSLSLRRCVDSGRFDLIFRFILGFVSRHVRRRRIGGPPKPPRFIRASCDALHCAEIEHINNYEIDTHTHVLCLSMRVVTVDINMYVWTWNRFGTQIIWNTINWYYMLVVFVVVREGSRTFDYNYSGILCLRMNCFIFENRNKVLIKYDRN